MPKEGKPDKLAAALAAGQLWRAKEILSTRISCGPYNPSECEQLGQILLRMGDDLEAGRYLFLSGERRPEYQAAIDLFVGRYARAGHNALLSRCPRGFQRTSWSKLPPNLQKELADSGLRRGTHEPLREKADISTASSRGCALGAGGILSFALLLAAYLVARACVT